MNYWQNKTLEVFSIHKTNSSFEWIDNGDGIFEPLAGDLLVDMGLRGMVPMVE